MVFDDLGMGINIFHIAPLSYLTAPMTLSNKSNVTSNVTILMLLILYVA